MLIVPSHHPLEPGFEEVIPAFKVEMFA